MAPLLIKSRKGIAVKQVSNNPLYFREFVVFCPHCKNMETIWLGEGAIQTERRYRQRNGNIYHDCGSTQPCRLYGPH